LKKINDILNLDINNKNVLIIGCPASGKTYLSSKLKSNHKIIHTDDYMHYGYDLSMYNVLNDIIESNENTLVEGVQGYRLLRKGIQMDCYYPDIVLELIISEQRMISTYKKERDLSKIKYLKTFNKVHDKILQDYLRLKNKNKPEWIKVLNDY